MIIAIGRAVYGETLKLKRTLALRMIFIAPILVALLALLVQSAAIARGRGDLSATLWESHARNFLTVWAVFLLPLLITLESALLCGIEHGDKQWKHIFALPLPRYAIFTAKFLMVQGLTLLSTLVLCFLIIVSGWMLILWTPSLAHTGLVPLWSILTRALQCWLAAGLILSANLWIALRWPSSTVALGAGIGGTFFALFATSAEGAKYYPWLLPFNVVSNSDRLLVSLMIGIGGGLLIAVLSCIDFCRREECASPKLTRLSTAVWVSMSVGFVAIAMYADRELLPGPQRPYTTEMITVDKGVSLEVLNWGGSGRPVVLLAGLGDTAHVFQKFANRLSRNYHVYGIARRGCGASSVPSFGYSADRLGDDVLVVISALKLKRPVLVGHSIAGEELSSVGSRYPEKIAGLVYLDAAYAYAYYNPSQGDLDIDLSELQRKLDGLKPGSIQGDPRPLIAELVASLPGFANVLREKLKDMDALSSPEASNQQYTANRPATQKLRPGFAAAQSIIAGEKKYTQIHARILAIYAIPHDTGNNNPRFAARDLASITGPQAKAVEVGLPSARVVRLQNANHYIFQLNEADVLREMNAFICGLPRQ